MKWNSKALSFSLDARDLAIMSQCRMKMDEIIGRSPDHEGVPPLWSVLSYEMLRNQTQSLNQFWKEYRQCELLEKERDRYYSLTCIPKNSTGVRKLHVPDWEISKHQQFMLKEILEHIPVNRCACAYRKGVGIKNCALPHVNQETVIHLDIKDFFSSITEEMVFKCIERGDDRNQERTAAPSGRRAMNISPLYPLAGYLAASSSLKSTPKPGLSLGYMYSPFISGAPGNIS